MQTITKYLAVIVLGLSVHFINAQAMNESKISALQEQKNFVEKQEREFLKIEVEAINTRMDNGEITLEEASILKQNLAEKRALNIENRIAIIDNRIALLERNKTVDYDTGANLEGLIIESGKTEEADE